MVWGGDTRSHLISPHPWSLSCSFSLCLSLSLTLPSVLLPLCLVGSSIGPRWASYLHTNNFTTKTEYRFREAASRFPWLLFIQGIACYVTDLQEIAKAWSVFFFTRGIGLTSLVLTDKLKAESKVFSESCQNSSCDTRKMSCQHWWLWLICVHLFKSIVCFSCMSATCVYSANRYQAVKLLSDTALTVDSNSMPQ